MTLLRQILALSVPAILANVATPLMSMSDMAISGRLGSADIIASVALGGVIFNLLYWLLGFLRMGTSGLTAHACGAADTRSITITLLRSLALAAGFGLMVILLRHPLVEWLLTLMEASGDVRDMARSYCLICVWGAPAVLAVNSFAGWYVGLQNSRLPMLMSVCQVALNIALSVTLVFGFGMKVEGIATGTLVAQWAGALLFLLSSVKRLSVRRVRLLDVFALDPLLRFFRINLDIFLRTLCMVAVTFWFTRIGTSHGNVVLAANAMIMQLFTFFSYFMDGYAYGAEGVCGRLSGAHEYGELRRAVGLLYRIGALTAIVCAIFYFIGGDGILSLLSHDGAVNRKAHEYLPWAVTVPVAGFAAFIGDGVAVGLIRTRLMLLSLVAATAVFFTAYAIAYPTIGNHGLWLAFVLYLATRSIFLFIRLRPAKVI